MFFSHRLVIWLPVLALASALVVSCKDKEQEKDDPKKSKSSLREEEDERPLSKEEKREVKERSAALAAFTGGHTKAVWSGQEKEDRADPFAVGTNSVVRGIDTKDGKGIRDLVEKRGNYARPLLNHDGSVILFTDKNIDKGDNNKKSYKPVIYRLSWDGKEPQKLAEGYAMDLWVDPATGIEWVYAAQKLATSTRIAIEAKEVVRFPLNDPGKVELVYDETPVGTDNIQLSRDGTRASGLFPWPHCGVFHIDKEGKWRAEKRLTGCWPSLAPDNSGVMWVFDGEHRNGYLFADDGRPHWVMPLNTDAKMKKAEVYHPRWSNHARYVAITGPYIKTKNETGSVIGKGGASADVYLARLDDKATKVEAWFQINDDKHGDAYPDVWIDGGDSSSLVGYGIGRDDGVKREVTWPVASEGLLLKWKDRDALNSFQTREGEKQETRLEGNGAARYGRFGERLLDGGWDEVTAELAAPAVKQIGGGKDFTIEALVYPGANGKSGYWWRGGGLTLKWEEGALLLSDGASTVKSPAMMPEKPFHLVVTRLAGKLSAFVDGLQAPLRPSQDGAVAPVPVAASASEILLGGEWDGGLQHLAVYDQAWNVELVEKNEAVAAAYLAHLPAPPTRVKLQAKLVEESAMPTAEGIDPYTGSLVAYVYEVEQVLSGEFEDKQVLVKHWGMLGRKPVAGLPREIGKSYELTIEMEADHLYLKGERVMDDTVGSLELSPWIDVAPPRVVE